MTEYSGPLVDHNFTDETWRALFGDQPGVVNDIAGTAYALALSTDSNTAFVGAEDQNSDSLVGGFLHRIPGGETQGIEIPPSNDATAGRTDVIGVEYDPTTTTEPGPCKLARIPGIEGSALVPAYTGIGDFLPLHEITRKAGQGLNQAVVQPVMQHRGPTLTRREGQPLPTNAPVGTMIRAGGLRWSRILDVTGTPTWRQEGGERPMVMVSRITAFSGGISGFEMPLYAGTAVTKRGDADSHLTGHMGASTQQAALTDRARITVETSGVYAYGVRMDNITSITTTMSLALGTTGTNLQGPNDARNVSPTGGDVSVTDTRWLPAGTNIQPIIAVWSGTITPRRWWLWATRISD